MQAQGKSIKENKMESMKVSRLVMNVSLPLMISLLVQSLYNIVDGIYVARISEKALTATSLAYPVQLLMVAVSVGTGVGINSYISRKIGAGEFEEVDQAATTGIILSVLSSVVFIIIGFLFTKSFFQIYTADQELIGSGTQYLQICTTFSMGIFVAAMGERILQSTGNTLYSMAAQVTGAVVNVALDPILIFGMLGFPEMGVKGAAVATVTGQWAAAVLALILVAKRKEVHFVFRDFHWKGTIVKEIYKVGCPSMFVQAMGSIMMIGVNNVLAGFSSTAVSFFGVYYKLQNFAFMPVSGLAQGLIPIVGYNYGARHGKRILDAVKTAMMMGIGIMLGATVLFLIIPRELLLMYHATQEMLEIGVPGLRILSLAFIPTAVVLVIGYMFTGLGNGMVNMLSTFFRMILPVPVVFVMAKVFKLEAVWHGFWITSVMAMGYCLVEFGRVYRKRIKEII